MKNTKKLYMIIFALVGLLIWREVLHIKRVESLKTLHQVEMSDLESDILKGCEKQLKKAREQGRNEVLEMF